ncbi:MAG: polysaccharide deacetylase family protein, partial [Myxococcota bacterium]
WIKVPTIVLTAAALWWFDGALAIGVAAAVMTLGTGILMAVVVHPNATLWTKTRWRGDSNSVALTFDDGPDPAATLKIAEILADHKIRAAFFVVGERTRAHPEIVAKLHEAGHLVCNHSDTHAPHFHFSLWGTVRRELRACNEAIASVIGAEPTLFRSPQGIKNPALGDVLREMDMTAVGWQVRGLDSLGDDPDAIERRILRGVAPGGVIMLHDGTGLGGRSDRSATIEALPRIIDGLRSRGLQFARLDELLGVEPYRAAS